MFLIFFSLAFCALPFFVFCNTACAGKVHQVTETELRVLEDIFSRQESIIGRLRVELNASRSSGMQSKESLERALNELERMKGDLMLLRQELARSASALALANRSLTEYEREMKRKVRIVRWQRNLSYALLVGGLVYAAGK